MSEQQISKAEQRKIARDEFRSAVAELAAMRERNMSWDDYSEQKRIVERLRDEIASTFELGQRVRVASRDYRAPTYGTFYGCEQMFTKIAYLQDGLSYAYVSDCYADQIFGYDE